MLAEEAKELGLVDRVCEPDALLDEAMAMADELAGNPPTQLRLIKQLLTPERQRDRPRRRPAARDRGARRRDQVARAQGGGGRLPRAAAPVFR